MSMTTIVLIIAGCAVLAGAAILAVLHEYEGHCDTEPGQWPPLDDRPLND